MLKNGVAILDKFLHFILNKDLANKILISINYVK